MKGNSHGLSLIIVISLMVTLVACGSRRVAEEPVIVEAQAQAVQANLTEAVPEVATPQPTATERSSVSPLATPTVAGQREASSPLSLPSAEAAAVPAGAESLVEKAKQMLVQMPQIQATAAEIQVQAVEPREWPDSSLGCPQPGMMYAQVVTPGYLIVLRVGGETYDFHTDQNEQVVPCFEQPEAQGGPEIDFF